MDLHQEIDLLKRLSTAAGVSGFEQTVQNEVREALPTGFKVRLDRIGNLIATGDPTRTGPRILLNAHSDEIGFVVTGVRPDGLLTFRPVGRWRAQDLVGQRVEIVSLDGPTPGLIELLGSHPFRSASDSSAPSFKSLYIDVGALSREDVAAQGIRVGQQVVPFTKFDVLANARSVIGKAFDDRVGVGVILEAVSSLVEIDSPASVTVAATAQEEIGSRGVQALELDARPDVAFVLEAIQANDVTGNANDESADSALGAGPNIVLMDDEMVSTPRLGEWAVETAGKEGIRFQLSVAGGSNDAKYIQALRGGVPTLVIGVPCRYIHRHNGLMRVDDYIETIRLITTLIHGLDDKVVRNLA